MVGEGAGVWTGMPAEALSSLKPRCAMSSATSGLVPWNKYLPRARPRARGMNTPHGGRRQGGVVACGVALHDTGARDDVLRPQRKGEAAVGPGKLGARVCASVHGTMGTRAQGANVHLVDTGVEHRM